MNLNLKPDDIDAIVRTLARRASSGLQGTPQVYFEDLIAAAHLPRQYRETIAGRFTGNARIDARRLVEWAIDQKINPEDPRYTVLGGLLRALLDQQLSPDDGRIIVAILYGYGLILDENQREDIGVRYMVPELAWRPAYAAADYGPDFEWGGPSDDLQLQSFFRPDPPWLDVGLLRRAMERSSAVCRIEIGARRGTGFLVGPNLLLTNYHVLQYRPDENIQANARRTVLRFGCFTTDQNNPADSRVFNLAANPIADQSPVGEYDFVLLRVEDKIQGQEAITPVPLDPSVPAESSSLNIIHHPGGDTMKLSLSGNGVTSIYSDRGLFQYVTTAAEGSSGSPCFNDEWKVVGLHHAQRARTFGSIREGILIQAIYDRIQRYL